MLLVGFVAAAGAWFFEAHAEYRQLKVFEAVEEQKLSAARWALAEHQRVLERMKSDPQFVEDVIREKMKYARPGEWVFRFED